MCLLHDCETSNFAKVRFQLYYSEVCPLPGYTDITATRPASTDTLTLGTTDPCSPPVLRTLSRHYVDIHVDISRHNVDTRCTVLRGAATPQLAAVLLRYLVLQIYSGLELLGNLQTGSSSVQCVQPGFIIFCATR